MQTQHQTGGYQEAVKATAGLMIWTIVWMATLALAKFGPTHLWDSQPVASWAAVAVNLAAGVGWMFAHARYLRELDELQRKINQDALAATLGVGLVIGFAYVVADGARLIARDVNVAVFPLLLGFVYLVAILVGHIRYQ